MNDMFRRLGLPDPLLVGKIRKDWESLIDERWRGRSKPLTIQGKTLVVEAGSPSQVAFLRYGVKNLLEAIEGRYGPGLIDAVDIRPPR